MFFSFFSNSIANILETGLSGVRARHSTIVSIEHCLRIFGFASYYGVGLSHLVSLLPQQRFKNLKNIRSGVSLSLLDEQDNQDLGSAVNIAIKYRNTWYRRCFFDVFSVSQRVSRQFHFVVSHVYRRYFSGHFQRYSIPILFPH